MSNLDMFNEITAKVFAECYEKFPMPVDFREIDLVPEECIDPNAEGVFSYTFSWLHDYGYITYAEPELPIDSFMHVRLTEKGISVLNMIPDSLKEKVTMGSKISNAVKSGAKDIISECIRQAVKYSLT